jgi:hypothetical protein
VRDDDRHRRSLLRVTGERPVTKGKIMTAEELASYIELLVMEGRASGLSDETMASQLQDAADALREGVS